MSHILGPPPALTVSRSTASPAYVPMGPRDYQVVVSGATEVTLNGTYTYLTMVQGAGRYTRKGPYGVQSDCTFHITRWPCPNGTYEWSISHLTSDNKCLDHFITDGKCNKLVPSNNAVWRCVHHNCKTCTLPVVSLVPLR